MAHPVLNDRSRLNRTKFGLSALCATLLALSGSAWAKDPKPTTQDASCEGKSMTSQTNSETVVHRSSGSHDATSTVTRGPNGEIIVTQSGPCNEAAVAQSGSRNRAVVSQSGSGNRVSVTQGPRLGDGS